ncbi:hypothetical protein [Dactylosporangium sp. NPDC048998]|uniref:hypothetical protein n=1 Tax=Dactylosporangium sp. NPDC048998 TaxID=3363976 RepID=UPI0037127A7C
MVLVVVAPCVDCRPTKANAAFTFAWLGAGQGLSSVGHMRRLCLLVMGMLSTGMLIAGCGGTAPPSGQANPPASTTAPGAASGGAQAPVPAESNPAGDIPDNIAFVSYTNTAGKYTFTHPEGWAETTRTTVVTFTDKLNGVQAMTGTATTPPTVDSAKTQDVPALTSSQAAFELRGITAVTFPAGQGVRIVYRRNSAPDPVTGRQYRDEVERYELVSAGREVIMELYGPVGADNVDAYKTMISSLRLT